MTIHPPICSDTNCPICKRGGTIVTDATVTYYTTDESTTLTWSPTSSPCGADHGAGGVYYDGDGTYSPGVTVVRMVPEEQVESLRGTVGNLYRQLGEAQRREKEAIGLLESVKEVCEEIVATPEQGPPLCADLGQHLELFLSQVGA